MPRRDVEDIYPLSPLQEGMLFHSLYSPEGGDYVRQLCFRLGPEADAELIERCWSLVVNRHPALRSSVEWKGLERPLQLVHRGVTLPVEQRTWANDAPDAEGWHETFLAEDRARGLEMSSAPLSRLTFLRGPGGEGELVFTFHHLLFDGWTRELLLAELRSCHAALARGDEPRLPERRPYREYIAWLADRDSSADEEWWRAYLSGVQTPTRLPADSGADGNAAADLHDVQLVLAAPAMDGLRELARRHRVTMSTLVQGIWGLLLSRYTGSPDVTFGVTVSGRPAELPGVETMIGLFINTVAMRVLVPDDTEILPWLQQLQAEQMQLRRHEHTPLPDIQRWSELGGGTALFDTLLVFGYPLDDSTQVEVDGFQLYRSDEQTNYPLTLMLLVGDTLEVTFLYDGRRFTRETVLRLRRHLQRLLEAVAEHPRTRCRDLEMLTPLELHGQLIEWNATEAPYARNACVHELVSLQARRTPNAVAVSAGHAQLTYAELDEQASRLGHRLRSAGADRGKVVALCVERSFDMVIGLLATLKSGAAYLPLEPRHPAERLSFMLEESAATVLLTQRHLLGNLPPHQAAVVCIDDEQVDLPSDTPARITSPEDLAYILYTSGSTGRPKGVQVRHRNVANLVGALAEKPGLSPHDVVLAVATYTFDMSVGDIFATLGNGARLVLASRHDVRDPRRLRTLIDTSGATVMHATPATWQMLVDSGWTGSSGLVAVSGGDTLSDGLAAALLDRCAAVWNGYGPTETTVYATFSRVSLGSPITIGRPVANVKAYILDCQQRPIPVGVPGELVISGEGVADGYVNRPDETAQRFVPDPFVAGLRMYRTGDLARFLPDGSIVHMGRLDRQVKIRGVRIEPGEIEAVLLARKSVAAIAVIAREDTPGDRRLVAYVVPHDTTPSVDELRRQLRERLPGHMVPAAFVVLERLPMTSTGKLDRAALPAPDGSRADTKHTYTAPRTELEEKLARVWARTLSVPEVGIDDDFFELGGHSLLAVRLVTAVEREFGVAVPLAAFFDGSATVAALAAAIGACNAAPEEGQPIVPTNSSGSRPVLFFVHPGESAMLSLRHFARALRPYQRVVGLLPERKGARFDPSRSVEDLAAAMLRTMRETQPIGPYYIAGFSFGGRLAYEIAGQLRAGGEDVAWLGVLDAGTPAFSRAAMRRTLSLRQRIARQRERGPLGSLRHLGTVVAREIRAGLVRVQLRESRLGDDFDWRGAHRLSSRYACSGHDAPMDLFVAADGVAQTRSRALGWEAVHKGSLRIHEVPGGHLTIVTEPAVFVVAEMLSDSLRRAQATQVVPA